MAIAENVPGGKQMQAGADDTAAEVHISVSFSIYSGFNVNHKQNYAWQIWCATLILLVLLTKILALCCL